MHSNKQLQVQHIRTTSSDLHQRSLHAPADPQGWFDLVGWQHQSWICKCRKCALPGGGKHGKCTQIRCRVGQQTSESYSGSFSMNSSTEQSVRAAGTRLSIGTSSMEMLIPLSRARITTCCKGCFCQSNHLHTDLKQGADCESADARFQPEPQDIAPLIASISLHGSHDEVQHNKCSVMYPPTLRATSDPERSSRGSGSV